MLTISQLARFVGVTVRAVRHYHARGLLPEPERDASGYRRYDAQAVVDLIRIKTLADAGVPLSRVSELLDSSSDEFARAVDQIDKDLQQRIRELQSHRRSVRGLAAGDNLVLPDAVIDYLARMRAAGMSERMIDGEREGWILLAAHSPDRVADWATLKDAMFDDPVFRDMYMTFDASVDWDADDPRIAQLADTFMAYGEGLDGELRKAYTESVDVVLDDTLSTLFDAQTADVPPAWERLTTLLAERQRSTT